MVEDEKLVSSKYIIEKSGISRATLNNYIKSGLLPKPLVRSPLESDKGPKTIGYFPSHVLERLDRIRLLKSEGYSMAMIGEALRKGLEDSPSHPLPSEKRSKERSAASETLSLFTNDPSFPDKPEKEPLAKTDYHQAPKNISPSLLPFCVVTVSLQDAERIALELLPEFFFALLDTLWGTVDDIVITNGGLISCPERDRMTAYFIHRQNPAYIENALQAALSIRGAMTSPIEVNRKGPLLRAGGPYLNIGLSYGEEYLTLIDDGRRVATSPGLAAAEAKILSSYARCGSVWATKSLLCRLSPEKRRSVHFGVTCGGRFERDLFLPLVDMMPDDPRRAAFLPGKAAGIVVAEVVRGTL